MGSTRITSNKGRCRKCNSVIESHHRHDFVTCPCGAVSVDGGHEYLRRAGNFEDFEELSTTEVWCYKCSTYHGDSSIEEAHDVPV